MPDRLLAASLQFSRNISGLPGRSIAPDFAATIAFELEARAFSIQALTEIRVPHPFRALCGKGGRPQKPISTIKIQAENALSGDYHYRATLFDRFPLRKKTGDRRRLHAAHGLELAALLAVEQGTLLAEDGQRWHAFIQGDPVLFREIEIRGHRSDVDVDEYKVGVE